MITIKNIINPEDPLMVRLVATERFYTMAIARMDGTDLTEAEKQKHRNIHITIQDAIKELKRNEG